MQAVATPFGFVPPVVAPVLAPVVAPAAAGAVAAAASLPVLPVAVAVGVGVVAAAAVAIAWGWANGRQPATEPGTQTWGPWPGEVRPVSICVVSTDGGSYINCYGGNVYTNYSISVRSIPFQGSSEYVQWIASLTPPDGETYDVCIASGAIDGRCLEFPIEGYGPQVSVLGPTGWAPEPAAPPYTPEPIPETEPDRLVPPRPVIVPPAPSPVPAQPKRDDPAPLAPPLPGEAPSPSPTPSQPDTAPAPGPTPTTPSRPPATEPATTPKPSPLPIDVPQPVGDPVPVDGSWAPPPALPPTVTPTDVHTVGGSPVTSTGPAPTMEGIAKEVGRIEEKLARLLDPNRTPATSPLDRLGELLKQLADIYQLMTALTSGGEYVINSPCVLDENDERINYTVPFSGSISAFGVLSNKLDAIAELLQHHKDLKQPICKQTPAVGENVTVNFVQVD